VQITDKTFEDAVKREAYEETKVTIKNLQLCTVVESDYF
jgi:ADP-ribose pyrophosphatase YjhB (NUDIX family)